jgi:hypothetical protein
VHPTRYFHLFADAQLRWAQALHSYVSGASDQTSYDPWKGSPLSYHGTVLRVGIGF